MTRTPPSIKAVVFDLDGLMFNTEDIFHASGRELLRRRGKELTRELLSQMMGRRAQEAFSIMVETLDLDESVEELLAESDAIFNGLLDDLLAPMPGLFELLEHIESLQLPKGVATSASRPYLDGILDRFELTERFDSTLTAEDVTHGKPHPEIYRKAADTFCIACHEMLVFEDSETGTRAAADAEAFVVSVPNKHSRTHDFSAASYIANSLHDPYILDLLNGRATTGP